MRQFVKKIGALTVLLTGIGFSACVTAQSTESTLPPVQAVKSLDLNRYLGKWYEIASIPQYFQKDCVAVTATYSLKADGNVDVLNECRKLTLDGAHTSANAKAWIPNANEPAKLKVQFFWPFTADYWVIDLAEDYSYAVVSEPTRKYLWILSRTPHISEELFQHIMGRLKENGYDLNQINRTLQP
jgi:apolipoprotein D and lipocalin family protein